MTNVIKIGNNEDGIDCAYVHYIDDDKTPYWRVHFNMSRVHWALFENDWYDKDIENFNSKDENNKYTSLQSIPKYHVYKDKVKLYKVNIEEEPEIAGLFRVMSVPTTTTISKSGDTYSQPGVLNEETLKYFLEGLIQKK